MSETPSGGEAADHDLSGDNVVEGVEKLAEGTDSAGVLRDPQDAKPRTAPVEQTVGDADMTQGQVVDGPGEPPADPIDVPETRMPEAPVSGGAQSAPSARVSDRVSAQDADDS